MATKFSTILPNENMPQINLEIPQFINNTYKIIPKIIGQNIQDEKYYLDSSEPKMFNETTFPVSTENLSEGSHDLKIVVSDTVGHVISKDFQFVIDNTPPVIIFKSPTNGSTVSGIISVILSINETNPLEKNWLTVHLPGKTVFDNDTIQYDTRTLQNGPYYIEAVAKDKAGNISDEKIVINVNNSITSFVPGKSDQNFITLIEIL
ncbi:MAG: hypothetical protein KGH88_09880, partial [Thaumarchaeota archaeon]|nr:hypothetical protein [Nitrososphaerota archaeon]